MSFIPVNEPILNGNEKKYLCECIDTGWISSEGPFVKQFEDQMASLVGRKYGVSVSSGTAALEVAVQALNICEGDEVIMPTFTIISCAMAVTKRGGVPVFVDSDRNTWNMCVDDIESKITNKTKAIMVVHIYGLPANMKTIMEIAHRYGLIVIEDAAEMHGQTYDGKACGSFGDISVFSFYPNKHITTGEGGMVLTDSEELAERCRSIRNLCFKKDPRYVHEEIGDNYRFTNLQAAIGLAQLERLGEFVEKKRRMGRIYTEMLSDIEDISLPIPSDEHADNIYWVFGIVLGERYKIDNRLMVKKLGEVGVGCRTFFWCMHEQPVYIKQGMFRGQRYPVAEYLSRKGFYIPSGLSLTDEQMTEVVNRLKDVLSRIN